VTLDALLAFPAAGGGLTVTNGHAYVDFSTMPTDKFEALLQSIRVSIWLAGNKTWYVRPDGNDNNDGSANTAAKAFRTIQGALDYVATNFNIGKYIATIYVDAGIYTENIVLPKYNATTGYCAISGASTASVIILGGIDASVSSGAWRINNMTIRSDGLPARGSSFQAIGMRAQSASDMVLTNIHFDFDVVPNSEVGATASLPIYIYNGKLELSENCEFNLPDRALGRSFWHNSGGLLRVTRPVVVNGVVSVATIYQSDNAKFARVNMPGNPSAVITGTVTGKRYQGTQGSTFNTGGGGANYFPGTIDGTASGDLYT
jgi:hypothetical protein